MSGVRAPQLSGAHRRDHVLVLSREGTDTLVFEFRGRRWAVICAVLAVLAGGGLVWAAPASDMPQLLRWLGYGVAAMFVIAALVNAVTRRVVVIDGSAGTIRDERSGPFTSHSHTVPFAELDGVVIYRNSTGSAGRSAFVRIMLVGGDHGPWVLGTSELGVASVQEARRLADAIARITNTQVVEDPSTTRQR